MSLRAFLISFAAFTLSLSLAPSTLEAASIPFGGLNFTLTNSTYSDGSASVSTDGSTLSIVGPNDGSGFPGSTYLTTTIPAAGTVAFQWSFSTMDDAGYEFFGYLLNGVLTPLADTNGESGNVSLSVNAGATFGFEADSADNNGGAGITTITNFSAPKSSVGAVPEPETWTLMLAGAGIGWLSLRRRHLTARS